MSRPLTAADRSSLIRLASTLPIGSSERRAILAAMDSDRERTPIFRDPYYRMMDGVISMKNAVDGTRDRMLAQLMANVEDAAGAVHRHLKRNYIWD